MSTLIVSIIIIGVVVLLMMGFSFINKRNKKDKEQRFVDLFNRAGEENGLSFSSQEVLRNKIIGLDGIHRKFVIVNEQEKITIINLDDIKKCFMQKNMETYSRVDEKSSGYEMFVKSIELQFEFIEGKGNERVLFYDYLLHPLIEAKLMETKAKDWEMILNKMVITPAKARA
jgi:hypothetical protein